MNIGMRIAVCAAMSVAMAFTKRNAAAQEEAQRPLPHDMKFEYVRDTALDQCPEESYFRDTVERRVSYPPFRKDATSRLVVTISREGTRYRGKWEVYDAAGLVRKREIPPPGVSALPDCYNLVQSLGLAFAIELEPLGKPATPPPPVSTTPPPPQPERPVPPPRPSPTRRYFLTVSGVAAFAETPDPAGGAALSFGRRFGAWSLAGELRAVVTLNNPIYAGVTSTLYRVTGAIVPCGHWRWLLGCALVEAGVLGAGSNAPQPASGTSFVGGAGLRAGLQIPLADPIALRIAVDGLIALPRVALVLDGEHRWESPVGYVVAGAGLMASF